MARNLPLESTIRSKIVKRINLRPLGAVQIRHQAGYNRKGDPDLTGSYRRLHVEIEVKRPGEKPTTLQAERLKYWLAVGAQVAVLRSPEGADQFCDLIDARIETGAAFSDTADPVLFDDVVKIELKKRGRKAFH